MRFPDVIVTGDGTLLIPAIQSAATFLDSFGDPIPVWRITETGNAAFRTLIANSITGDYGSAVVFGCTVQLSNASTWVNGGPKLITEGAVDSGGIGFRVLRVVN